MILNWTDFKTAVDIRSASVQWVVVGQNYWLKLLDGPFELECMIPVDRSSCTETADFEDNYKANGNWQPNAQVTTQFEKRDKTLKLACGYVPVDPTTGQSIILLKIPGTPGSGEGRWLSSGVSWHQDTVPHKASVYFSDEDGISGAPAGTVVGSYTDDEMPTENQGWLIPETTSKIKAESVGGYGFAPAGFYVKVVGQKSGSAPFTGYFCLDMEWAKVDV